MKCINVIVFFTLFLSCAVHAQERTYSKEFERCSKQAVSVDAKLDCVGAEIINQKKRINAGYAKLAKMLNPEDKLNFDKVQREWITWRDDNYNFLAEHVPGEFGTTRTTSLDFFLKSVYDRASEIEMVLDETGGNSISKK